MPAPHPRMHGNAHDHGGPDPVGIAWEATSGSGAASTSTLILEAAPTWNHVIPTGVLRPIHWQLHDDPPADFDEFWYLADASDEIIPPPVGPGVEFVYLGVKKWGSITCSGWVARPTLATNYFSVAQAAINGGLTFCTFETYDHRIKNLGFAGVGTPFRVWGAPFELSISFRQDSGADMTLSPTGSVAWCNVVFQEHSQV